MVFLNFSKQKQQDGKVFPEANTLFKESQQFRQNISKNISALQCEKHKNIDSEVDIVYAFVNDKFIISGINIEPCCEEFEEQVFALLEFTQNIVK